MGLIRNRYLNGIRYRLTHLLRANIRYEEWANYYITTATNMTQVRRSRAQREALRDARQDQLDDLFELKLLEQY